MGRGHPGGVMDASFFPTFAQPKDQLSLLKVNLPTECQQFSFSDAGRRVHASRR
jgi:hypothetical protein